MAEAGAHLTSTCAGERPSVFEVLAQESLMEAVRPALRHAVQVLAESNPSSFGCLWRRFDEVYLVLDLLLQNHFLSHCSASFSENFYGLKRVSGGRGQSLLLHRKSHWRSLLLLCLAPYLRAKLEAMLEQHRDEADFSIQLAQSRRRRLYGVAVATYPYASSAWRVLSFCQQLLFIFGVASTHNPLLWLARVRLARLSGRDLRELELRSSSGGGGGYPAEQSLVKKACWLVSRLARSMAVPLSTSLSMGVFFLQFLEWWYSSENQSAVKSLTSLPAPPPPLHLQEEEEEEHSRGLPPHRKCPLCRRPPTNTTVLSTSGFVFCYRCIYMQVKANHCCPVTGYPTELQHLVKIYSPET